MLHPSALRAVLLFTIVVLFQGCASQMPWKEISEMKKLEWPSSVAERLKDQVEPLATYTDDEANNFVANGIRWMLNESNRKANRILKQSQWLKDTHRHLPSIASTVYGVDPRKAVYRRWRYTPLIQGFDSHTQQPIYHKVEWFDGKTRLVTESPDRLRFDFFGRERNEVFLPTAIIRPAVSKTEPKKVIVESEKRLLPSYPVYEYPTSFLRYLSGKDSEGFKKQFYKLVMVWTQNLYSKDRFIKKERLELLRRWSNIDHVFHEMESRKLPSSKSIDYFTSRYIIPGSSDPFRPLQPQSLVIETARHGHEPFDKMVLSEAPQGIKSSHMLPDLNEPASPSSERTISD